MERASERGGSEGLVWRSRYLFSPTRSFIPTAPITSQIDGLISTTVIPISEGYQWMRAMTKGANELEEDDFDPLWKVIAL